MPGDTDILEQDASKTRSRTLTSKGREYQCELKTRAALACDREFRAKLRSFEDFFRDCKNPDEIRGEIPHIAREVDEVQQAFDDLFDLSDDTRECQRAANKQSYIYDTWKIAHTTAVQETKRLEEVIKSVYSQKSGRSRTSTKSGVQQKFIQRDTYCLPGQKRCSKRET